MAQLHYLNWDHEEDNHSPASTMFHELHVDESDYTEFTETEFDELYREVTEVDSEDPEEIWRQWNQGSGHESQQFIDLQYCENCDGYFDSPGRAEVHAREDHGYDPLKTGLPGYIHGERSMSVGDVVELEDKFEMAMPIGFQEITVTGDTQ